MSRADGEVLRGRRELDWWRGGGGQVGRCACGFTPAFGRAVGVFDPGGFMSRLKPCPFRLSLWGRVSGSLEYAGSGAIGIRVYGYTPEANQKPRMVPMVV